MQSDTGRYQLGEALGRGGQGRTFRAVDRDDDQTVAVKVIKLNSADGWKPFDLFERECAVLSALDHNGIPRYRDTFANEEKGEYYLVMDLVEGQSLQRLIEDQRPVAASQLWNILHQLLEILDYLHSRHPPVIHRDVKPDNIIRRQDGTVALVDFGGVRVAIRPEGGSTVVGTFGYMAPEQLHGEATAATDIYGLGATMAALATATAADKLPHKGLKIDLDGVIADRSLRDLLARMLAPDPEQRLASVAAVRQAATHHNQTIDNAAAASHTTQGTAAADGRATPTDELEASDDDQADFDEELGPFILRMLATLGYVGILFLETIFLPVLFFVARRLSNPHKYARLKERERKARSLLTDGRKSMKALAQKKRVPRQLPPHRRGANPALPPSRRQRRQRRHRHGHRRRR